MDNQPATISSKRQGSRLLNCPLMEKNGATIASINNDMEATQKQNTQPKKEHFFRGSQIYTHCWRSHARWQCKSASIWEIWRSAEWLQSWNWETQWSVVLLFVYLSYCPRYLICSPPRCICTLQDMYKLSNANSKSRSAQEREQLKVLRLHWGSLTDFLA